MSRSCPFPPHILSLSPFSLSVPLSPFPLSVPLSSPLSLSVPLPLSHPLSPSLAPPLSLPLSLLLSLTLSRAPWSPPPCAQCGRSARGPSWPSATWRGARGQACSRRKRRPQGKRCPTRATVRVQLPRSQRPHECTLHSTVQSCAVVHLYSTAALSQPRFLRVASSALFAIQSLCMIGDSGVGTIFPPLSLHSFHLPAYILS